MSRKRVTIITEHDLLQLSYDNAVQALEISQAETERCKAVVAKAKIALDQANKTKRIRNGKELQRKLTAQHMKIKKEHERNLKQIEKREKAEEARRLIKIKQKEVDELVDPSNLLDVINLTPPRASRGGKLTRRKVKNTKKSRKHLRI